MAYTKGDARAPALIRRPTPPDRPTTERQAPARSNAGGAVRGLERAAQVKAMNAERRVGKRPPLAGGTVISSPVTIAQGAARVLIPTTPQVQAFAVPAFLGGPQLRRATGSKAVSTFSKSRPRRKL